MYRGIERSSCSSGQKGRGTTEVGLFHALVEHGVNRNTHAWICSGSHFLHSDSRLRQFADWLAQWCLVLRLLDDSCSLWIVWGSGIGRFQLLCNTCWMQKCLFSLFTLPLNLVYFSEMHFIHRKLLFHPHPAKQRVTFKVLNIINYDLHFFISLSHSRTGKAYSIADIADIFPSCDTIVLANLSSQRVPWDQFTIHVTEHMLAVPLCHACLHCLSLRMNTDLILERNPLVINVKGRKGWPNYPPVTRGFLGKIPEALLHSLQSPWERSLTPRIHV